jgi:hypothetical protein
MAARTTIFYCQKPNIADEEDADRLRKMMQMDRGVPILGKPKPESEIIYPLTLLMSSL